MSRFGTRDIFISRQSMIPPDVSDARRFEQAQAALLQLAQVGTQTAQLAAADIRLGARREEAARNIERSDIALGIAAERTIQEEQQREQIKQRINNEKLEQEFDRLRDLETKGWIELMSRSSPEQIKARIDSYRFLDPQNERNVQSFLGRKVGGNILTQLTRELAEYASDPNNDPRDFPLTNRFYELRGQAPLTDAADVAMQEYALPQLENMQRGALMRWADIQRSELKDDLEAQLIDGWSSYWRADSGSADNLLMIGQDVKALTAGGSDETVRNRHVEVAMRQAQNLVNQGAEDPRVIREQLLALEGGKGTVRARLINLGLLDWLDGEIRTAETRNGLAVLGEVSKNLTEAMRGNGNLQWVRAEIDGLERMDPAPDSPIALARDGLLARARNMERQLTRAAGDRDRIYQMLSNQGPVEGTPKGWVPSEKAKNQVWDEIELDPAEKVRLFAGAGLVPERAIDDMVRALDMTQGADPERALRIWHAINDADPARAGRILLTNRIRGIGLLRRLVQWTRGRGLDDPKSQEILQLLRVPGFTEALVEPAQVGNLTARNIYDDGRGFRMSRERVREALDLNAGDSIPDINTRAYQDLYALSWALNRIDARNTGVDQDTLEPIVHEDAMTEFRARYFMRRSRKAGAQIVPRESFPSLSGAGADERNAIERIGDAAAMVENEHDAIMRLDVDVRVAGGRRWFPVVARDPDKAEQTHGVVAYAEWDEESGRFELHQRSTDQRLFDAATNRLISNTAMIELNPIAELRRREGEPATVTALGEQVESRYYQIVSYIEREWRRMYPDAGDFDIESQRGRAFADSVVRDQLEFTDGFGRMLIPQDEYETLETF